MFLFELGIIETAEPGRSENMNRPKGGRPRQLERARVAALWSGSIASLIRTGPAALDTALTLLLWYSWFRFFRGSRWGTVTGTLRKTANVFAEIASSPPAFASSVAVDLGWWAGLKALAQVLPNGALGWGHIVSHTILEQGKAGTVQADQAYRSAWLASIRPHEAGSRREKETEMEWVTRVEKEHPEWIQEANRAARDVHLGTLNDHFKGLLPEPSVDSGMDVWAAAAWAAAMVLMMKSGFRAVESPGGIAALAGAL